MRIVDSFVGKDGKERLILQDRFYIEYVFVVDPEGDVYLAHGNANPFEYVEMEIGDFDGYEWNIVGGEVELVKEDDGTFVVYSQKNVWPYDRYTIAGGYVGNWDEDHYVDDNGCIRELGTDEIVYKPWYVENCECKED